MPTPDDGLTSLRRIAVDFEHFCQSNGAASEADTRSKLIDGILFDVLGWVEAEVTREEYVKPGFMDYSIRVRNRPFIVIEAKREGESFVLPAGITHRSLKIGGALLSEQSVRDAVTQVRQYCDDAGVRY